MNRSIRLTAAVVAMIQIANLQYAWTQFVQPLRDAQGWELSEIQWAFSIFIALETWAMPLTGWLIDAKGARLLMSIAGILCGIGWGGLAYVESLPALYFFYGLAGFGAAIVYCGSIGVALKWFPDRRGFASGIIAAGFGAGSALYAEPVRYILRVHDYQSAFLYTGVLQGILIIAAAQFLGGTGQAAASVSAAKKSSSLRNQTVNLNSGEMLRTYQFYWLYAMMLMMGIGGLLATAQVSQVAATFGVASGALAVSLTLNPVANGCGRVFWGWVSDRIGREGAMQIAFFIQALALIGVATIGAQSSVMFVIAMALVFFTWGPVYVLFPSTSADFFGAKNASSNYSFLYSTKGVAALIAGGSAAAVFEATGSWRPAFFGSAMLVALALVMAIRLKKIPLPSKSEVPAAALAATEQ